MDGIAVASIIASSVTVLTVIGGAVKFGRSQGRMEGTVTGIGKQVTDGLSACNQRIDDLGDASDKRIDSVEGRVTHLDRRVNGVVGAQTRRKRESR